MKKRGLVRFSLSLAIALLILSLFLLMAPLNLTSAIIKSQTYDLGSPVKIDLSEIQDYTLKIKTPSDQYSVQGSNEVFSFKPTESGHYTLILSHQDNQETFSFQVIDPNAQLIGEPEPPKPEPIPPTSQEPEISPTDSTEANNNPELNDRPTSGLDINNSSDSQDNNSLTSQPSDTYANGNETQITVGVPVKHTLIESIPSGQNKVKLKVPVQAENISVKNTQTAQEVQTEISENKVANLVTQLVSQGDNLGSKSLTLESPPEEILIEYETPAPQKSELQEFPNQKEVVVSSPEGLHYENVLSYTTIGETTSDPNAISIYWEEEDTYLDFKAYDTNNNSLLDYVEWTIPHLSTQTFTIIIEIQDAVHLDANKTLISNIYDSVSDLDSIWSPTISSEEYIRITFEENLTSNRDITIYPRITSGSPEIKVYEKGQDLVLATFSNLVNKRHKVLLSNLTNSQDTFDLKILNGSLEFDFITDPLTEIHYTGFESGADGWSDPGEDADRQAEGTGDEDPPSQCDDSGSCSDDGGFTFHIQDDTTTSHTEQSFDFTGYDTVNLSFWSWESDFNPGEYVHIECDGTEIWRLTDGEFANEQWLFFSVIIYPANCTFDSSVPIRFTGNPGLSGNGDDWVFDGINLTGSFTDTTSPQVTINFSMNESYPTSSFPFNFNVTLNEEGSQVFYTLDGGTNNVSLVSTDSIHYNATNSSMDPGSYTLQVYANDTSGNRNDTESVTFSIIDLGYDYFGFETGRQGWSDGGEDSNRTTIFANVTDLGSPGGSFTWQIQDNSGTSYLERNFSFSGYDEINVSWNAYYSSIESGEELELRCDGTTVWSYDANDAGTEDQWLGPSQDQQVTIYPANCTFDSEVALRFEGEFSGNGDDVYLDGINVSYINLVDLASPEVTINFPQNTTYFDTDLPFNFNVTLNEAGSQVLYSLSGDPNVTMATSDNLNYNYTNDSIATGSYTFQVYTNDTSGNRNDTESVTFSVVTLGQLTLDLIDPTTNINVNPNEFFTFTAQVNCLNGLCGYVNATLDPPLDPWWNNTYKKRRNINISNTAGVSMPSGFSIEIAVNTSLDERFLSSGDDARVIYYNGTDHIELDIYNETVFNSDSTTLWFATQSAISSGSADDNYYLYYNNSNPGTPLRNASNVFVFFDDFDRADSGTIGNGWTEESGTWAITSRRLRQSSGGHGDASRSTVSNNHSIRLIANHENSDADWKAVGRSTGLSSAYAFGYQNGQNELGSGAHNSGNLCQSSFSPSTGNDYEVEMHMFDDNIVGIVDDTVYCNETSTTHTSGETWIHAWDVSQFDNVWVRHYIGSDPASTIGSEENESIKGAISMIPGTLPFYTLDQNPNSYQNTSCLGAMGSGESCNVTWTVNATGLIGSVWEFFVEANSTNYTISNMSSRINVTIGNLPPNTPELDLPINNSAFNTFTEFNWTNSTDPTGDPIFYIFEISDSLDFSSHSYQNRSIVETDEPTGDTPSGISTDGEYYWRVRATDLKGNSSYTEIRTFFYDTTPPNVSLLFPANDTTNTTSNTLAFDYNVTDLTNVTTCSLIVDGQVNVTDNSITKGILQRFNANLPNAVYLWSVNCTDEVGNVGSSEVRTLNVSVTNNIPVAHEIECEESGSFQECSNIGFGETITRLRLRCTDAESSVTNATFNITNLPDSTTFFLNTSNETSGGYVIFNNTDFVVNDSGDFRIETTCYDSESLFSSNSTSWEVPWGTLTLDLVNPNENINVQKDVFFNFTASVSCQTGECSNVNATLDPPLDPWWNNTYKKRRNINISNTAGVSMPSGFSIEIAVNTSLDERFLSSGDDARVIYYNGTDHIELDIYNETVFNSDSTTLWFATQSAISSGSADDNYYLYYNNSNPGTPLRNASNVFVFFDDFDRADSGTIGNGWTEESGTWAITSRRLRQSSGGHGDASRSTVSNNHSIRLIANHENSDADWKAVGRSTGLSSAYAFGYQNGQNELGSGAHNSGNLCQSSFSPSTGNDYEVEMHMFDDNIVGIVDDTVYCNETSTTHTSGETWIHAWDVSQFDNVWVRHYIGSDPTSTLGGEENESIKGVIPMFAGVPFYTTTENPHSHLNSSCLQDMKLGDSCTITWEVNATGDTGSVWEFFVQGNTTNYTSYFSAGNISEKINITIVTQLAPTVPNLYLPLNGSSIDAVQNLNWSNSTDPNADPIFYYLQVDNNQDFSSPEYINNTIAETTNTTGDTPSSLAQGTYYWRVLSTDLIDNSSYSEVRVFYLDTQPPNITLINLTGEDDILINISNPVDQGETFTIFANITDINIDTAWVVIWESVSGGAQLATQALQLVAGALYYAAIATSEAFSNINYNFTIYANDTQNRTSTVEGNFTLLKGEISLDLDPNPVGSVTNVTASGYLNLSNGSSQGNYPFNLYINGSLLLLSNLTPIGSYDFHQEFNQTSSTQFNYSAVYQNTTTDGENITLSPGSASGNYTRILDAGARVEWNNVLWISSGASCAATVTFQDGDSRAYNNTQDTYISTSSQGSNFGRAKSLTFDGSPTERGLIMFDSVVGRAFNQVPENSTILGANLTVTVFDTGNAVTIYEILENWTEGPGGASAANWTSRLPGVAWGSTGLAGSPSRASTSQDSFTPSSAGNYTFDILNAVNRWTNTSSTNYGVVLDVGTSNGVGIRSSEYSVQQERPKLTVQYSSTECTNLIVYARTSNDKSSWSSWQELTNGGSITDPNLASRYLEYRLDLTSTSQSLTPRLQEIVFNYTATVTNSTGDFEYNFTNPSAFGNYLVSANSSLRTINFRDSVSLNVQTSVVPEISLVLPANGTWFSSVPFNLTYNATDDNDDLTNATLIINGIANQTNSSQIINGGHSNFSIDFSSGIYTWSVNVTDNTNNIVNSSTRTFYIDLEGPNISLIYPDNASVYSVNLLNLSYNATDNLDPTLLCNVTLDGSVIHSGVPSASGVTINRSSGVLTNGLHHWNVTCVDESSGSFTSETWQFNISDTPPEIELVRPINDYVDSDGDISFIFNATDSNGFTNATIILSGVKNETNQTQIFNGQNTTITVNSIPEGIHNWTVLVYDNGGLNATAVLRNFTVDLTPPQINLNLPTNDSVVSTGDINLNFTALDALDTSLLCNLSVGETQDLNFAASNGSVTNRLISSLTDGLKYWNVTCIDDAGNANTSITREVTIAEPPTVFLNTTNATSFSVPVFNLSYTSHDNTGFAFCNLSIAGVSNQTNSSAITNNALNNFTVSGLSDGSYNWTVNCTDTFGLTAQAPERTFFVDSGAPIITLYNPNNEELSTENITFNYSAIDSIDTSFDCSLTVDTTIVDANFTVSNGTVIDRTISGISDGFHTWFVNCTDSADNTGNSAIYNFTRSTPPEVTLTSPASGQWFNTNLINLSYFPIDDEGFQFSTLYINSQVNQTNSTEIVNNGNNNFTIQDFADGSYNWTVRVTDFRGLNTTASPNRTIYIDTHVPNLTLNTPNGSQTITTNNVSFNFTVSDNLDPSISCELFVDGESEYNNNVTSGSNVLNYILVSDGLHFWNVTCVDEATNTNISQTINFTVEAPPNVTLIEPNNSAIINTLNVTFIYLPEDPIGFANCSVFIDGIQNETDTTITQNVNNNITVENIPEGAHNWTVQCFDAAPDFNPYSPPTRNFSIDRTAPQITINNPTQNLNTLRQVNFNFTALDNQDDVMSCDLYIDGILNISNIAAANATPISNSLGQLALGAHQWNVTCADNATNLGVSSVIDFNVTLSDLFINSSYITFNNTSPTENETVQINATIFNLVNVTTSDIVVQFFDGDPESGGTQIQTNQTISLNPLANQTLSVLWQADLGPSDIYVVVDPPISSNGSIEEYNESNNLAFNSIAVGGWHFVVGDLESLSELDLQDIENQSVTRWESVNVNSGNLYVADSESLISWSSLQAISRDVTSGRTTNDFTDLDSLLSMTTFQDSISNLYTNSSGDPQNASSFTIFQNIISNVPVTNSTNNTNFVTGILWDTSDNNITANDEFDQTDQEDLIFVAKISQDLQGAYGIYDYEIRIPARLREYISADSRRVVFYAEIT